MYYKRELEESLIKHLPKKEYTIIVGARQTGKTTLLRDLYKKTKNENKTVAYISFEDLDILTGINSHPEEIFSFVPRPGEQIDEKKRVYLFIDEIQYADNPTNFLKYLYDSYGENLKIIATGSSAFYIDNKFKDSLAGRKRIFELKTLSFREWLLFQSEDEMITELDLIRSQQNYISAYRIKLLNLFDKYIVYGGYPRVALEPDDEEKQILMKELKNSYLKRDIIDAGVEQADKFYQLMSILAVQSGNLLNRNELAKTIGIDHKTVDKYLFVLQKSFHISLLKPFHSNIRKELIKMPKIFFNDTGMRNAVLNRYYDFNNRDDNGALFENYIFRRLTDIFDKENIRFWRTTDQKEIDFVVTESYNEGKAYEVKLKCKEKTLNPPKVFSQKYRGYSYQLISYDFNEKCLWFLKLK